MHQRKYCAFAKNASFLLLLAGTMPIASAQLNHDPVLAEVDRETMREIQTEMTYPQARFKEDSRNLLNQALSTNADIKTVYKAILFADARLWTVGNMSAGGSDDALKLRQALGRFDQPPSFEMAKAKLLMRSREWGMPEEWEQLRQLAKQAPEDQPLHLSYLVMMVGYGDKKGGDCPWLIAETTRLLAKQPRYYSLYVLRGLAKVSYGSTHPAEKKAYYAKGLADYRAFIKIDHPTPMAFIYTLSARLEKILSQKNK